MTEWLEDRKNRCLSVSTNSGGLHFGERVQKINENGPKKKMKNENVQNGHEKHGGKKHSLSCTVMAKFQKCYNFFKFSFEMRLKGYLPESV